jgi:5-methylcytosine-specific restriction endonuclease McrA
MSESVTGSYGLKSRVNGKYNPEYGRVYRSKNKERCKAAYRRYIERNPKRDHRTREYRIMAVNLIYDRDHGVCGVCKLHVERLDASVDHIVQVAKGGGHESSNLQLSHLKCNLTRPKWNRRQGRKCTVSGCEGKHRALGLCNKHYLARVK